jgi:hypothetical protein
MLVLKPASVRPVPDRPVAQAAALYRQGLHIPLAGVVVGTEIPVGAVEGTLTVTSALAAVVMLQSPSALT